MEFETHENLSASTAQEYEKMVSDWALPFIRRHLPPSEYACSRDPVNLNICFQELIKKGIRPEMTQSELIIGQPREMVYRFLSGGIILQELKIKMVFE